MLSPSTMDDAAMTATRSLSSRLACDAFEFKSSFDARDDARNSPARPAADRDQALWPPSEQDLRDCVGGWIEKVPALDCVDLCNEDGNLLGHEFNEQTTVAWHKALRGKGGSPSGAQLTFSSGRSSWRAL